MEPDDDRPDAAVARVNAGVQHARVRLAEAIHRVLVQHANHFVQTNLRSRSRQGIAAVCTALRLDKASLNQNPHQLAGISGRQTLAFGDLIQRQRAAGYLFASQLHKAAQTIFFVSGNLHFSDLLGFRPDYSIPYFLIKFRDRSKPAQPKRVTCALLSPSMKQNPNNNSVLCAGHTLLKLENQTLSLGVVLWLRLFTRASHDPNAHWARSNVGYTTAGSGKSKGHSNARRSITAVTRGTR